MLNFLPKFLVGIITVILYLLSTIIFPILIIVVGILRLLIPFSFWRKQMDRLIRIFAIVWIYISRFIMWLTINTKFEITGTGKLTRKGRYLLISNHQSWVDVFILEIFFGTKIPMLMFFMKKQLIWSAPIIGVSCWAAGFPFMQRYKPSYLKKHPEKKGQDLNTTKKLCKRFINQPLTITIFLEGTRFTVAKKQQQHSPYQHLLKPKMTGFAFVLAAMEQSLHDIINVTIVYPAGKISLWDFICGRIDKIIVKYEVIPITDNLRGDYNDRMFRAKLQKWLNQKWLEKDKFIGENMDKKR